MKKISSLVKNPLVQLALALIVVLTIAGLDQAASITAALQDAAVTAAGFISIVALVWVMKKVS